MNINTKWIPALTVLMAMQSGAVLADSGKKNGGKKATIAELNAETSAREAADSELQSLLNAEASTRETADSDLQSLLNTEASARETADSDLQSLLNAEASAREAADIDLKNQRDADETNNVYALERLQNQRDDDEAANASARELLQGQIKTSKVRGFGINNKNDGASIANYLNVPIDISGPVGGTLYFVGEPLSVDIEEGQYITMSGLLNLRTDSFYDPDGFPLNYYIGACSDQGFGANYFTGGWVLPRPAELFVDRTYPVSGIELNLLPGTYDIGICLSFGGTNPNLTDLKANATINGYFQVFN